MHECITLLLEAESIQERPLSNNNLVICHKLVPNPQVNVEQQDQCIGRLRALNAPLHFRAEVVRSGEAWSGILARSIAKVESSQRELGWREALCSQPKGSREKSR